MGEDLNLDHVMLGTPKPHMRVERGLPASNLPHPPRGHSADILPLRDTFASQEPVVEPLEPEESPGIVTEDKEATWNAGDYKQDPHIMGLISRLENCGFPEAAIRDVISNANPNSPNFQSRSFSDILKEHGIVTLRPRATFRPDDGNNSPQGGTEP